MLACLHIVPIQVKTYFAHIYIQYLHLTSPHTSTHHNLLLQFNFFTMSILLRFQSQFFFHLRDVLFPFTQRKKISQFVSQIHSLLLFFFFFVGIVFTPLVPLVLFQFVISINHCYKIALFSFCNTIHTVFMPTIMNPHK